MIKITKKTKKILVGAAAAIVVLFGASWFYTNISTPYYSLYQMNQSLNKRDYKQFSRYVNVDLIVQQAADKIREQAIKQIGTSNPAALSLIDAQINQLKEQAKQGVKREVENGELGKQLYQKDMRKGYKETKLKKDGGNYKVTIKTSEGKDFTFVMKRLDGRWQIIELDLSALNPQQ